MANDDDDDDGGECDGCGRDVDVIEACEECGGDFCCLCLDGGLCSECQPLSDDEFDEREREEPSSCRKCGGGGDYTECVSCDFGFCPECIESGLCEECRQAVHDRLHREAFEAVRWQGLSDRQRENEIRWAMNHGCGQVIGGGRG